ncbi:MAG: hypothetical protein HGA37_00555, partial [Lentimicrobium sp.]|nr:hypothetical protein [Lentimicrobium sp.]
MQKKPTYLRWFVVLTMMAFIWLGNTQANAMGDGTKSATTPDNASEIAPPAQRGATAIIPQGRLELGGNRLPSSLLYDNGPLVNSPGTGAGGADESVLQSTSLGMGTIGFGFQYLVGNHIADDFVVAGNWTIDQFTFYAYQTGSTTTSTITGGYLQIFDGDPSAGGTLIWGDMVTNRMASTSFTNIYRVTQTTSGATNRPIMEVVCSTPGLVLSAGTYWVEYTIDGSLASGPWAPPVTINGQTTTGNAHQSLVGVWGPANDGGTLTLQGFPFLIEGTAAAPGLDFVSPSLSMGFRPIGAWMEPARYEVVNIPGGGAASIATADIDNTYDGFVEVVAPALPFILDEGETTTEFGLTATDAAVAPGAFNGTFALIYGSARAMITATYDGTAYTPLYADVIETAGPLPPTVANMAPAAIPQPSGRESGGLYKNYILPNDLGASATDVDYAYILEPPVDMLLNLTTSFGSPVNYAVYAEDFEGEGGPMAHNALVQSIDVLTNFPMFAGDTYYMIGSALNSWGGSYTLLPMPVPDAVTYVSPADGAININNGMSLNWLFGANVAEYQVILGTTYPPATVVVDWTSDLAESYTLTGLNPNLQYFWQINVRNTQGTTFGPVWGFTTTIDVPTGLTASVVDPGPTVPTVAVNLSWTGNNSRAFLGYNVYRNGVKINPALVTGTTYNDPGLARNTTYTYNVTAVFDEGESAFSLPAVVTTQGVGIVNGTVTDVLVTTPIAGASVVISGPAGTYNLTTAANGTYSAQVYAGTYSYTVSAPGYINGTASGVVVAHAATVTLNFALLETPFPVDYVIATELNEENVLLQWGFDLDKGAGNRALVEFQVWREKVYLPGAFEQIGTTSQTQFVDFDWGLQDWGVYRWYIVAVYTANQSAPVGSNTLDKDMNTMVDVTVVLNSNDSPAGTMVTFQNISEPFLDLTYSTTLGASGTFEWDAFRRGTYDIEVYKAGYVPVFESSVDIFDESSFEWLLIEILAAPENLYVTPTGLATWEAGAVPPPLRSFQNYKVFLDGVLVAEVADPLYQYGTNGEALVDGETYLAEVAAVYSTGQSAKTGYTWTYIACDNYATPGSFTAVQVEGTVDVSLTWTVPTIPPADDQIDFARLYRDGEVLAELTGTSYLDEDLDFATYTYCITFVYESGAETCPATICETVEVIGGGFVNGNVKQAAYLGGANIEGAEVVLTNTADNTITFTFTTNAAGNYTGEVLAGTYDYVVSAAGYVSETLEDVFIAQTATVTRNFVLMEYPFPVSNVVAVDQETSALIYWNTPGTNQGGSNTVYEEFDNGMPSMLVTDTPAANWTVANDFLNLNTPGAGVWRSAYYNAEFGDFMYEVEMQRTVGAVTGSMGIYVRGTGLMNPTVGSGSYANVFTITQNGSYWYATLLDGDLMGDWTGWLTSSAINTTGPNVLSAVASGSTVQFMVNGILVHTVTNTTLTGGYCGVFAHEGTVANTTVWDYMMIEPGTVVVRDLMTNHISRETKGNLQEVFTTNVNTVEPRGLNVHTPVTGSGRELMGYNVWRTSCDGTAGLTFLGYTLDSTFVDNQFGALDAGVYKWAVEAVYTANNAEPQFSNCLDKDMITQVSVTVTTNSLDSPVETQVMFTNTSEPDLELVYEVELDETGYYAWDEFRKGTYDIYVEKYGFAPIAISGYVIDGPEAFEWVLEELLMPVADLYVTPTAYATWRQGGIIPFEPTSFDFEADAQGWEIQNVATGWRWGNNASLSSSFMNFNGNSTNFIAVNADGAGSAGPAIVEMAKSPVMDLSNAQMAYLNFDYLLRFDDLSVHYSIAGGSPVLLEQLDEYYTAGWASVSIELPEEALVADVQIIFLFEEANTWGYGAGVDNVAVTDEAPENARALQYYK